MWKFVAKRVGERKNESERKTERDWERKRRNRDGDVQLVCKYEQRATELYRPKQLYVLSPIER